MIEQDATFERLKGQTLDLLGSVGGIWMEFDDLAAEHLQCDGELDELMLRGVLVDLVAEGLVERNDDDEYRWTQRQEGDDAWTDEDRNRAVRAVEVATGKDEHADDIHAQLAAVRKDLADVRESLGEAVTLLGRLVAMAENEHG